MNLQQRALLTLVIVALFVLSGCWTFSLHPLYGDDDPNVTYEPALEGTWKGGNDDSLLVITGDSKSREYTLQLVGNDTSNSDSCRDNHSDLAYSGRLVQLGGDWFLDVVPHGEGTAGAVPAHNIFKISVQEDSLLLSPLTLDWLCRAHESEQAALGQCIDGDFILTASTDVLQDFVSDRSDDGQVFPTTDDNDGLHRVAKPGSVE